jgi:hypothetical protein
VRVVAVGVSQAHVFRNMDEKAEYGLSVSALVIIGPIKSNVGWLLSKRDLCGCCLCGLGLDVVHIRVPANVVLRDGN